MNEELMMRILENQEKHGQALASLDARLEAHFAYSTQEIARLSLREDALTSELNRAKGAIQLGAVIMTTGLTCLGLILAAL